jgi:hypothetical protein
MVDRDKTNTRDRTILRKRTYRLVRADRPAKEPFTTRVKVLPDMLLVGYNRSAREGTPRGQCTCVEDSQGLQRSEARKRAHGDVGDAHAIEIEGSGAVGVAGQVREETEAAGQQPAHEEHEQHDFASSSVKSFLLLYIL